MDIITKVMFIYTICNLVPRKEGREKVAIQDYILNNKLLDGDVIGLPILIMKHLDHTKSVQKHGIPYGCVIKKILEYCECYTEGHDPVVLGKALNSRCLTQAYFKFEEITKTWHKVPRPLT